MKYRNEKAICNTALALSKHATPSGFNWVNKQCPDLSAGYCGLDRTEEDL